MTSATCPIYFSVICSVFIEGSVGQGLALDWDSGELGSIPSSANRLLGGLRQVALMLSDSVSSSVKRRY